MKLEVDRDALLSALRQVADVVASRNTIPVLGNLLLVADGSALSITGTDLDLQATASVPATGELRTTVDKNKMLGAVESLRAGGLTFEAGKGKPLLIRQGKSQRTLQTLPADDFPKREPLANAASFRIAAPSLLRLLNIAAPAISKEEARYYLCGVYLHFVDGVMRAVATDGKRMVRVEMHAPDGADGVPNVILPEKTVNHLRRLLDKVDGEITLQVTDTGIGASWGSTQIVSKVVEGTYPDYERVIPELVDQQITLARDALIEPMEGVAKILNLEGDKFKHRKIVLELGGGEGNQIWGRDSAGSAAQEPVDAHYEGAPIKFGIDWQLARSVLGIFAESASLSLSIADPEAQLRITSDKDPDVVAVIMPMRV